MAQEEAACNQINCLWWFHQWLHCIAGNVGARFWKAVKWSSIALLKYCWTHCEKFKNKCSKLAEPEIPTFLLHEFLFCFKTRSLHYPQINLATEWHHQSEFILLNASSPEAKKGFILLFHTRSSTPQELSVKLVLQIDWQPKLRLTTN